MNEEGVTLLDHWDGHQYRIIEERPAEPNPQTMIGTVYLRRVDNERVYWAHRYGNGNIGLPSPVMFYSGPYR